MSAILLSLILGIGAGIIDVIPMIIQKLDNYSIASALAQWLVVSFVIGLITVPGVSGWLKGLMVAVIMALPIVIIVAKNDLKSVPIILIISAILGSVIGYLSKALSK
jgi:hypothetical protein